MPRGPLIHRTPAIGRVLRHVRRDVHPAEFPYEFLRVVGLVPSHGHALSRRKSTSPPGPGAWPVPSFGRKLLWLAQASISVPSTVKCSSDINGLALSSTRWKNDSATSSFSKRSRFLLYTA